MKFDIDKAFKDNVTMGFGTYMGGAKFSIYDPNTKVTICNFTSIAQDTRFVLGGQHENFVTQYPFNDPDIKQSYPDLHLSSYPYNCNNGNIWIGSDVWIGYGCLILSGTHIQHGSVIGAGSVVRKKVYDQVDKKWQDHIPPYAIVMGNPATIVSYRFDGPTRYDLVEIAWWDWPLPKIAKALPLLFSNNIQTFIDKYRRKA